MKQSSAQALLKSNKKIITELETYLIGYKENARTLWNLCDKNSPDSELFSKLNGSKNAIRMVKKEIFMLSELSILLKTHTRKYYGK